MNSVYHFGLSRADREGQNFNYSSAFPLSQLIKPPLSGISGNEGRKGTADVSHSTWKSHIRLKYLHCPDVKRGS